MQVNFIQRRYPHLVLFLWNRYMESFHIVHPYKSSLKFVFHLQVSREASNSYIFVE